MPSAQLFRRRYTKRMVSVFVPFLLMTICIVVGVLNFDKIREFIIGATGEEANIQIDTQAIIGPMAYPWRNLAQGGEDKDWRIQPIVGQVRALKPEYIRIDHFYDFYNPVSRSGGGLSFNWAKADTIVSDILATGAKPYISLSYTPPFLAPGGDITGQPTNYDDYQLVIQKTVEHFSRDRGIDNMIYEVWNEPDLFGRWSSSGGKNYLNLYAAAARGAQIAASTGAKPFKFGGPATTGLYENWIKNLLDYASKNNLRIDFLSWHRYSRDIEDYRKDIANIENYVAQFPQFPNLEFHITEWGHNSNVDPGFDGNFGAVHTAAVSTEFVGKIQRAFVFEIQDGKSGDGKEYWGRWGLLTHRDFGSRAKPRYRMLRFLDNIGDQRLQILGKGTWVKGMAARIGEVPTAILVNYDPYGRHSETVPVTFKGLTDQTFIFEKQFFDGGSTRETIATTEAELKVVVPMNANGVVFLKLTPQR